MGLGYNAFRTIYRGAILPLLLYGAPIWINILNKYCYIRKPTRFQRLINIRIAKSYGTVSNEALCMITGLNPIDVKIKKKLSFFKLSKDKKVWITSLTMTRK